ncbi:MAG: tRNA (adenosine(37)-N6)-threonylcarbamoyltransferase complex ATPase subunit type 1 TsaE [Firmicutes bacterium]|nr:tRNA (adenosine(37)-N6)-threonylcarbamoyltransferase complex ATPase subunit type 1 TsaE [Bacillota bacterium]
MIYYTENESKTYEIAKKIGQNAKKGDIYCLCGDLGVGKTVFAKGFAKGLGIEEHITSPTFTIVNQYKKGDLTFCHFDAYRVEESDEMLNIGFEDYLSEDNICLIEWANLIEDIIPKSAVYIKISKDYEKDTDYRKIEVI